MPRPQYVYVYVYVYNGPGSGVNSSADLKELFTSYGIYDNVNVCFSDFQESFSGLDPKQITFAIPGGSVIEMGGHLAPLRGNLQTLFDSGSQGMFICAGAYLACSDAQLFRDNYIRSPHTQQFSPLQYSYNTQADPMRGDISLHLVHDYSAFGSFIPNDSYQSYENALHGTIRKPYLVSLKWEIPDTVSPSQLFLGGCGFELTHAAPLSPQRVVATYADRDRYSFFYPRTATLRTIPHMAAIIQKPGMLLSGPHLEACVDNSRFFKMLQEGDGKNFLSLPDNQVQYDAHASREIIIPMLKDTFSWKRC